MQVSTNSSKALRDLARAFRYRKRSLFVEDRAELELQGGYWCEGSREAYALYIPPSTIKALRYPTDPPQFGGGSPPLFRIPAGAYVVQGGTFRGKAAHFSVYGIDALRFFCGIESESESESAQDPAIGELERFEAAACKLCGGALQLLGSLGNRVHYRCRYCGMEYSRAGDLNETREAIARACERGE